MPNTSDLVEARSDMRCPHFQCKIPRVSTIVPSESNIYVHSLNSTHITIQRENGELSAAMPAVPFHCSCKQATCVPQICWCPALHMMRQLPKAMLQIQPDPMSRPIFFTVTQAWPHPHRPLITLWHRAETGLLLYSNPVAVHLPWS